MNIKLLIQELNSISDVVWYFEKRENYRRETYDIYSSIDKNIKCSIILECDSYGKGKTHYEFKEVFTIEVDGKVVNLYREIYDVESNTIYVSKSKTEKTIAKELNKRLIVDYLPKVKQYVEQYLKQQSKKDLRKSVLDCLCEKAGIEKPSSKSSLWKEDYENGKAHGGYGNKIDKIHVDYYASQIDLALENLTKEQALQVIELVKSFN